MTSTADVERNLARAEALVDAGRRARRDASSACPRTSRSCAARASPCPSRRRSTAPGCAHGGRGARAIAVTLLLGSHARALRRRRARVHNTSVAPRPGRRARSAVYRKIHLFDIDLPGMEHLKESRAVAPGERSRGGAGSAVRRIGLSICYDLRFPELYRGSSGRGADVLAVPSAFTERTGKDHWEVLLRARAIENLAYVVAPAQSASTAQGALLPRPRPDRGPLGRRCSPRCQTARASRWPSWTSTARPPPPRAARPSHTPPRPPLTSQEQAVRLRHRLSCFPERCMSAASRV